MKQYSIWRIRLGFLLIAGFMEVSTLATAQTSLQEEQVGAKEQPVEIGQVLIVGFEGTVFTPELAELIAEIQPGGVLLLRRNIENASQVKQLVADLQRASIKASGYPLFVAVDQEGWPINRVSWAKPQTAQSALEDFSQAYLVGQDRAGILAGLGFNMNLAPVLDSTAPSDFLFSRSVQKVYDEAQEVIKGLVWGHEKEGVLVVPKHFPGYDGISSNPEYDEIPTVSSLPDTELFTGVFENTSQKFVMLSHVVYEDIDAVRPFPFSPEGIRYLKQELSEDVIIMTDDLVSPSLTGTYDAAEIGARALSGGAEILLVAGHQDAGLVAEFYKGLRTIVESDSSLQARVRGASQKILSAKQDFLSQ
jgi:beta-N-acetylhexosaminidase